MIEDKADEILIGAHFSSAGGVHKALLRAKECEASTLQLFTANQKQWHGKPISEDEIKRWHETVKTTKLKQILNKNYNNIRQALQPYPNRGDRECIGQPIWEH